MALFWMLWITQIRLFHFLNCRYFQFFFVFSCLFFWDIYSGKCRQKLLVCFLWIDFYFVLLLLLRNIRDTFNIDVWIRRKKILYFFDTAYFREWYMICWNCCVRALLQLILTGMVESGKYYRMLKLNCEHTGDRISIRLDLVWYNQSKHRIQSMNVNISDWVELCSTRVRSQRFKLWSRLYTI